MQEIDVEVPVQEPKPPSEGYQHREIPPIGQRSGNPISEAEEQRIFRSFTTLVESMSDDEGEGSTEQKTQKLNELRPDFSITWTSGSRQFAHVAELLANACRNPSWRLPLGQSGYLDVFLQVIASEEIDDSILLHSLRLIGNACADTNENRQYVITPDRTPAFLGLMDKGIMPQIVSPVVFNICNDLEPAVEQFANNGALSSLLSLLANDKVDHDTLPLNICHQLLELFSALDVRSSPDSALHTIFHELSMLQDGIQVPHFICLAGSLTSHLKEARFQEKLSNGELFDNFIELLPRSYQFNDESLGDDERRGIVSVRLKINSIISDFSSTPQFSKLCFPASPLFVKFKSWLDRPENDVQVCACIALGNLARNDAMCETFVQEFKLHDALIRLLQKPNVRGSVLYSAISFLKNLAVAPNNKTVLASSGVIPAICPLWKHPFPADVPLQAISLTRLLTTSSFETVHVLLEYAPQEPDSEEPQQTYLSRLFNVFLKTDEKHIATEVGRTVMTMCRSIAMARRSRSEQPERARDADHVWEKLFSLDGIDKNVGKVISALIKQTDWPIVRSEGIFILGLLVLDDLGSPAGIACVNEEGIPQVLREAVEEKPPTDENDSRRLHFEKTRSNAILAVAKLVDRNPPGLDAKVATFLSDLYRDIPQPDISSSSTRTFTA